MTCLRVDGTSTWSVYDAHGSTSSTGSFTAVPQADEFGVGTTPASRLGWLGKQQRPSVGGALGLIRMGVRLYDPALGRFLEVDPVEGGSCNDYDYVCGDPVNGFDLGGTMLPRGDKKDDPKDWMRWYDARKPDTTCIPGLKGASQILGYRSGVQAANDLRQGHFADAGRAAIGQGTTTAARRALTRAGDFARAPAQGAHNAGILPFGMKALGGLGEVAGKLTGPVAGLLATGIDYMCDSPTRKRR